MYNMCGSWYSCCSIMVHSPRIYTYTQCIHDKGYKQSRVCESSSLRSVARARARCYGNTRAYGKTRDCDRDMATHVTWSHGSHVSAVVELLRHSLLRHSLVHVGHGTETPGRRWRNHQLLSWTKYMVIEIII